MATTARQRGQHQCYLTPSEVRSQIRNKSGLAKVGILFGCEESGLSNAQLAQADLVSYLPLRVGYPSLNLGQAVMVYCYQLATLIQQPAKSDTTADKHQLQALRERAMTLLTTLAVADDIKLVDWLQQRLGLLEQRDTAMLHRLLHDIEKNITK
mgnify:CR=1 FL=1